MYAQGNEETLEMAKILSCDGMFLNHDYLI